MLNDSFHWIIDGKLAGYEKPSKKELHMLKSMGFTTIICLQENVKKAPMWESLSDYDFCGYTQKDVRALGMEFYQIPVEDMKPPTKEQMDRFIELVDRKDKVTLVHCYGGIGRTGCMLAAYLGVKNNICGEETLKIIRGVWKPYIQTIEQKDAVVKYIDSKHRAAKASVHTL